MNLPALLDASLEELLALSYGLPPMVEPLGSYCEILIAYLKGDVETLERQQEKLNLPEHVRHLLVLRLKIRKRDISDSDLTFFHAALAQAPRAWSGEASFVLSLLAADLGRHAEFEEYSKLAARDLETMGAKKKSVKALLNAVVAKSRLQPNRHLIPDYVLVFRKARALKVFDSAGICLQNISKEYHVLGSHSTALFYANRAVQYLSRYHNNYNYYLALLQRAYIFYSLGRKAEAARDLDEARAASFSEVQEAIKAFEAKSGSAPDASCDLSKLTPAWKERAQEKIPVRSLGLLEQKLIHFLSRGPQTRMELIENLYGHKIDSLAAENRFKNLIARLRRRKPGLIVNHDGRYHLSEPNINGAA